MNYEHVWKVIEALIVEISSKGVTVPPKYVEDLKSALTFIKIYNTEPTDTNAVAEIERYIDTVEINLLNLAETELGAQYADECMRKIYDARTKAADAKISVPSKFVSGVPKEDHWIRIKISDLLTTNELNKLLRTYQLSSKPQDDGYLLIHGTKDQVKEFIRAMSQKLQSKST